jgi:AraC-like DNA-binding protein
MNNNPTDFSGLSESFKALIVNPELVFQVYDLFPIPIEIFTPDGTSIFINRAWMEFNNLQDANLIVGKYNVKNDSVMLEIFGQENMDKLFRGEYCSGEGYPVPIQDLVDRDVISKKPFETATMDLFCLPVWDGDRFLYVVCIFIMKNVYRGKPEIAKAKQYIDEHWLDEFNAEAVAKKVCVSPGHLGVLFKNNTGMTMNDYYKKVKVEHIKEKLMDKNLSIAEAFSFCGEDSRGAFVRTFKELTGVTPTEYRNSMK